MEPLSTEGRGALGSTMETTMVWTLATIAAFVILTCFVLSTISLMQIAYDVKLIRMALSPQPEERDQS